MFTGSFNTIYKKLMQLMELPLHWYHVTYASKIANNQCAFHSNYDIFLVNLSFKNAKRHRHIAGQNILTIISGSGILIFVNMISVLLARLRSICGFFKDTNRLLNKIITHVKDFYCKETLFLKKKATLMPAC
jgi:hypothetical protein